MQKLHQIHEALEDDIVETQSGNAKIIDLMHQIIHVGCLKVIKEGGNKVARIQFSLQTAQMNARQQFDGITDRMESQSKGR